MTPKFVHHYLGYFLCGLVAMSHSIYLLNSHYCYVLETSYIEEKYNAKRKGHYAVKEYMVGILVVVSLIVFCSIDIPC